jgi:hypothetical protein
MIIMLLNGIRSFLFHILSDWQGMDSTYFANAIGVGLDGYFYHEKRTLDEKHITLYSDNALIHNSEKEREKITLPGFI